MHPIEQLRYVARAAGEGPALLAREAAGALAAFGDDPAGMVTACRRLVDRQPTSGPIWWLAARVLGAPIDGAAEAWQSASLLERDRTGATLEETLPHDGTAVVLGWPEQAGTALRRRGDVRVLVVDAAGEGGGLVRRLLSAGVDAELVDETGLGAAVSAGDVLLLEASAVGPDGFVAIAGSYAAAAVARHVGVEVWLVAGVGRILPARLWDALAGRLDGDAGDAPWRQLDERVPLDVVDWVVGSGGRERPAAATARVDCPVPAELLKEIR